MNNIEIKIQKLMELLVIKKSMLEKILALTMAQGNLIKQGELEILSEIMEEKQQLIHEVNGVDMAFLENYQNLKTMEKIQSLEELNGQAYPSLIQLKQHVAEIVALLERMEILDKSNQGKLHEDFDALKKEMNKFKTEQQNKKMVSNYMKKYSHVQGVFVDNKDK